MITLITAVPGSGKTLYAVSLIQGFLNEGRPVYQNIDGLQVDAFDNNHLLFDAPDDWRETPDGSVVIYDECQQAHLYPATGERGKVLDSRLTALETHRHTGHDLFFITQAPTFVHHHVRKLVGCHVHFYRGSGATSVARYEWSHTCDNPNDRQEQRRADFSIFRFDKKLFDKYKSSTVHTHKLKIPKKLVFIAIMTLSIFAFAAVMFSQGGIFGGNATGAAVAEGQWPAAALPVSDSGTPYGYLATTPEVVPVGGCISSEKTCRCYTKDLVPLDLPVTQCRALVRSPLPMTAKITDKST